jgi:hypothetical protein
MATFWFLFNRTKRGDVRISLGWHLNPLHHDIHILFGIIFWCIWAHRNQLVFEDKFFDGEAVVIHTRSLLQDINRVDNTFPHMEKSYSYIQVGWTNPSDGWLKCNTNEAQIALNHQAGCDRVFRDESISWLESFRTQD